MLSLSVISGVISANVVSYDYYAYTQFPGFTSFTEAEMKQFMTASDFTNGDKDTSVGPANMVTWNISM